ncbi:hypothetical protein ACVW0Z_000790 [Ewingella americana]
MRVLPSQSGPAFNGSISSSADETLFWNPAACQHLEPG